MCFENKVLWTISMHDVCSALASCIFRQYKSYLAPWQHAMQTIMAPPSSSAHHMVLLLLFLVVVRRPRRTTSSNREADQRGGRLLGPEQGRGQPEEDLRQGLLHHHHHLLLQRLRPRQVLDRPLRPPLPDSPWHSKSGSARICEDHWSLINEYILLNFSIH